DILQPSMHGGLPDRPVVTRVRQILDIHVNDGSARNDAISEIWQAVDAGDVQPLAIGSRRAQIVKLEPEFTKQIPLLRSPRGRGFTLVRPSNPAFHQLAGWFGRSFPETTNLIFKETEIRKLASNLRRTRRRKSSSDGARKPRGAPSRQEAVKP